MCRATNSDLLVDTLAGQEWTTLLCDADTTRILARVHELNIDDRFLLTYSSPHSKLCLVASGPNPALPTIRERLADTSEDVLFGYAEVHGKGLVIAFMKDNVG